MEFCSKKAMNDTIRSQRSCNPYTTIRIPSYAGSTRRLKRRDTVSGQNVETFFKRPPLTTFSAVDFQKRYEDDKISDRGSSESSIRSFLERFSLPRVVKTPDDAVLLYKYVEDYTSVVGMKIPGKGRKKDIPDNSNLLYFPDGYQGWFSVINDEKNACAVSYSSIVQLIQEQVYTFLSTTPIVGYVVNPEQSGSYLKFTSLAGEVFQLRGIFQHNPRICADPESTRNRGRDLANRYAQLINQHTKQDMYVPLIGKGCFYEIASSQVRPLQNSLCKVRVQNPLQLDKDCIYRLSHLIKLVKLPITVKLIAGQIPNSFKKTNNTDVFILQSKITTPVLFGCKLPMNTSSNYEIKYYNYQTPNIKFTRTLLGFESEHTMLQSTRLQNAFAFTRQSFEKFYSRARTHTEFTDFQSELNQVVNVVPQRSERKILSWFKNLKLDSSSQNNVDRYKDMSKLIDETYARNQKNPVRKSGSFMFTRDEIRLQPGQSLDSVCNPHRLEAHTFSQQDLSGVKHSYITDRLCSKFHVKTKNVKKTPGKVKLPQVEVPPPTVAPVLDEYVCAIDALGSSGSKMETENIYVEICENDIENQNDLESSYVHLNLTNTEIDEPIYSTLK